MNSTSKEINVLKPKSLEFTRWLLIPLGVWPFIKKYPKNYEIIFAIFLQIYCYFIILFTVIPTSYHMIVREENLNLKIALIGPISFFTMNLMKYTVILYRRDKIKKCIEHIENDWKNNNNNEEYNIMLKNVIVGRKLTILCALFIYTGGLSYHTIMPFITVTPASAGHNRPIVFPGHDIAFNSFISPFYELVFIAHVLLALVVYNIITVSCNLAANFVTHACSQIQIVVWKLQRLAGDKYYDSHENDKYLQTRVSDIVKIHARVLKFTLDIENVLREICLVEFFLSTTLICWLEYCCLTTWSESDAIGIFTYFMLLVALSFNIFMFCYIGDLLKEQCEAAGNSTYLINWYHLPPNIASALILIIASAQIPRKITAGGLVNLSLRSFVSVIKTTLVYLNLLRTVTE